MLRWTFVLERDCTSLRRFQLNDMIMAPKDARDTIKSYNRVARGLVEFDVLQQGVWRVNLKAALDRLELPLLLRHARSGAHRVRSIAVSCAVSCTTLRESRLVKMIILQIGKLAVNLDHSLQRLVKETRYLQPPVLSPFEIQMVAARKRKCQTYATKLRFILKARHLTRTSGDCFKLLCLNSVTSSSNLTT